MWPLHISSRTPCFLFMVARGVGERALLGLEGAGPSMWAEPRPQLRVRLSPTQMYTHRHTHTHTYTYTIPHGLVTLTHLSGGQKGGSGATKI